MTRKDRIAIWIAWHLPRSIAYHAYARVAVAGDKPGQPYPGNPSDQMVTEPMKRWEAATR